MGNVTLTSTTTWVLDGLVFVNAGQTLSIEAGTVIKGKSGQGENASALVVARDTRHTYGQSPYIINIMLGYENNKGDWSANIAYNIWGERLSFVSRGRVSDVYEQSRGVLDFTFEKGFGKKWSIKIKALNLLNPDYLQSHDFNGEQYDFEKYSVGRTYSLGVKYSF